jgi:hypothetical protein
MWLSCFAHYLSKNTYSNYRTTKEAICIVHPDEHRLIDQGTVKQREAYQLKYPETSWFVFYDKQEELKFKYNEKTNPNRRH